jgi:hypothetical protein
LRKLNFHVHYKSANPKEEHSNDKEKENFIVEKEKSLKGSTVKNDQSKLNSSTLKAGSVKRESPNSDGQNGEGEEGVHEDNSENKAMKVIYSKRFR